MTDLEITETGFRQDEEKRKLVAAQDFGRAVTQRRKELRWSQQNLADALTTTQSVVSAIEHGNYLLTLDLVARLARALRVPPTTLARSYWLNEENTELGIETSTLDKIRVLITEFYQIGEIVISEPPAAFPSPNQPRHQLSAHDEAGIEAIIQQRRSQAAKDKAKGKEKENSKSNSEEI